MANLINIDELPQGDANIESFVMFGIGEFLNKTPLSQLQAILFENVNVGNLETVWVATLEPFVFDKNYNVGTLSAPQETPSFFNFTNIRAGRKIRIFYKFADLPSGVTWINNTDDNFIANETCLLELIAHRPTTQFPTILGEVIKL